MLPVDSGGLYRMSCFGFFLWSFTVLQKIFLTYLVFSTSEEQEVETLDLQMCPLEVIGWFCLFKIIIPLKGRHFTQFK